MTLTATGGAAPYTYMTSAGALPPGLSLALNRALSGVPTSPSTYNFTVEATDTGGCTGTQLYELTIDCPTLSLAPAVLPNAVIGFPYSQTITASMPKSQILVA